MITLNEDGPALDPSKHFEELPQDIQKIIKDAFRHPKKYDFEAALERARALADGLSGEIENIWAIDPYTLDSQMPKDNQSKRIINMPPLMLALYAGDFETAGNLLSSKKYGNFSKMNKVTSFDINRNRKPRKTGIKTVEDSYIYELENKYDYENFSEFIMLGMYAAEGKRMPVELCYRLVKGYEKAEPGKAFSLRISHNMPFIIENQHVAAGLMEFFIFLRKKDKELYQRLMNKRTYIGLVMALAGEKDVEKSFKKIPADEIFDGYQDIDLWNILADILCKPETDSKTYDGLAGVFKYNLEAVGSGVGKLWKKIFGQMPVFDFDCFDLGALKQESEDLDHFFLGYNPYYQENKICGAFLEFLIRNADHVKGVYGENPFNLNQLVLFNEELTIMALKKDFIRRVDTGNMIEFVTKNNKMDLIPALVLKEAGEWGTKR